MITPLIRFKLLKIFVLLWILHLISCKLILRQVIGIKNPKIVSIEQTKNDAQSIFSMDSSVAIEEYQFRKFNDSMDIQRVLYAPLFKSRIFFNKNGERLCYYGPKTQCGGDRFYNSTRYGYQVLKPCIDSTLKQDSISAFFRIHSLPDLKQLIQPLFPIDTSLKYNLYVTYFWSSHLEHSKAKSKDFIELCKEVKKIDSSVCIIRINANLSDEYYRFQNKRTKLRMKKQGSGMEIWFENPPIAKE